MDLMIDLEALASTPDAVIVSIGAVAFEPDWRKREWPVGGLSNSDNVYELAENHGFHRIIDLNQPGRRIDPATVQWWMQQDKEAQYEVTESTRIELWTALHDLAQFYIENKCRNVWSHGVTFDVIIMDNVMEQTGFPRIWKYGWTRDTRTLFDLASNGENEKLYKSLWPDNPLKHNPLWDAATQAVAVQNAYARLSLVDVVA